MRPSQKVRRSPVAGTADAAAPGTRSPDPPGGRMLLQISRPMLAPVRSRGDVTFPGDDVTAVRAEPGHRMVDIAHRHGR